MGCISSKTIPILTSQQSVTPVSGGDEKDDTPSEVRHLGLGSVQLVDSHHSEDGYHYKVQIDITLPMSKQFDKSELNRQANEEFIKKVNISAEQEREVINCIRTLKISCFGFFDDRLSGFDTTIDVGSIRQVAGQFKHTHMRDCPLSPEMIEAILSRLVIQRNGEAGAKNKRHVLWSDEWPEISYTDESPTYGKGVREFCFSWNK